MSPATVDTADRPHSVYRAYDSDGTLLYVGITNQRLNRFVFHQQGTDWWEQVAFVTFEHVPDRATARAIEDKAILDEQPIFNQRAIGLTREESAALAERARQFVPGVPSQAGETAGDAA